MAVEEQGPGPELQRAVEMVESQIQERMDAGQARREAAVAVMGDVIRWQVRGQDSLPQAVKEALGAAIERLMTDEGLPRYAAESETVAYLCAPVFHHPENPFTWEVEWAISDGPSRRSGRETGPEVEPLLRAVLAHAADMWPAGDPRLAQLEGDLAEHARDPGRRPPGAANSFKREWVRVIITFAPGTPRVTAG